MNERTNSFHSIGLFTLQATELKMYDFVQTHTPPKYFSLVNRHFRTVAFETWNFERIFIPDVNATTLGTILSRPGISMILTVTR